MPSINDFDRLYRVTQKGIGDSNRAVSIRLKPVPPKTLRVLTHVTVENRTTPNTDCRLGIDAGGVINYLDEITNLAVNELAVSRSDIILGEGDYFLARLTDTITGDELVMTCIGWDKDI